MKKLFMVAGLTVLFALFTVQPSNAQSFIKKVKKRAEDAAINKMFEDESQTDNQQGKSLNPSDNGDSPSNSRGEGLNASSYDVLGSIASAESSFSSKSYSEARFSVRQAIQGIELEIGKNILNELPESIAGLPRIESEDAVTSSGIGFVGLVINRVYREKDQQIQVTIGNDAAMLSVANMYLASGVYSTSSQEENVKQTTFKDHRAVIVFDESSGYQLSVPFGQSSILIILGINFINEDEFMHASEEVDIENIKNQLGEK